MLVTTRDLKKLSSPAQWPQYTMTIPAGTKCKLVDGKPVVDDIAKVQNGNRHDLEHYYIWLDAVDVTET